MRDILLLSGGVDSLVLLASEVAAGRKPLCLSFAYGQRHAKELDAAKAIADYYSVFRQLVGLPAEVLAGSSLTGTGAVPLGKHYADPAQAATVAPNRNLLFLSAAAAIGAREGAAVVLFAAHAGDAAAYPDCRPEFVAAADKAMRLACNVGVVAPFLGMSKGEVVALGRQLAAPLELAWSCYVGGKRPCGQCGACVERAEAGA